MRRLLNVRPSRGGRLFLGLAPILALVMLYLVASAARHADNPADRILPTPAAMGEAVKVMAFQADPRTGEIPLIADTRASLRRLGAALTLSTATTLILGLGIGLMPWPAPGWGRWSPPSRSFRRSPCCRSCSSCSAWARPPRSP